MRENFTNVYKILQTFIKFLNSYRKKCEVFRKWVILKKLTNLGKFEKIY